MDTWLQAILDELRRRLEALYGDDLLTLVLFGSQARGDAEPGSDIDVLVVLNRPVSAGVEIEHTGSIIADLSLRYDTVISCVFISAERYYKEQSPFLLNVRREGIAA